MNKGQATEAGEATQPDAGTMLTTCRVCLHFFTLEAWPLVATPRYWKRWRCDCCAAKADAKRKPQRN